MPLKPRVLMTDPEDPLDPLLGLWKGPDRRCTDLAPEVWRRIAFEESRPSAATQAWEALCGWLARPPFAALFVASCVLLGLLLAQVHVNRQQRDHGVQLARSYLQYIDPLYREEARPKLR